MVFWIATIFWVGRTPGGGSSDRLLVWLVTLIGAVPPFLGPLIYMLFRPPEYLEDVRERELEIKAIEGGSAAASSTARSAAPRSTPIPRLPGLHDEAPPGVRELPAAARAGWQVCPYCETPVEHDRARRSQLAAARRATRPSRTSPAGTVSLAAAWQSSAH